MRIAVISDLHIGADVFSPGGFADFLDHVER
jgi:3',5'-cyclic AMP phosphodiesterase CpdA